jgi:hypothetical protein
MTSRTERLKALKRQVDYVRNLPITTETNRQIFNSSQLNESSFEINNNEMSNIQSEHNEDFNREFEDSMLESKTVKESPSHEYNHFISSLHVKHPKILKNLEKEPLEDINEKFTRSAKGKEIVRGEEAFCDIKIENLQSEILENGPHQADELLGVKEDVFSNQNEQLKPEYIEDNHDLPNEQIDIHHEIDRQDLKAEFTNCEIDQADINENWAQDLDGPLQNNEYIQNQTDRADELRDPEAGCNNNQEPVESIQVLNFTSIQKDTTESPVINTQTSIIQPRKPANPNPKLVTQKSGFRSVRPPCPVFNMPLSENEILNPDLHDPVQRLIESTPSEINEVDETTANLEINHQNQNFEEKIENRNNFKKSDDLAFEFNCEKQAIQEPVRQKTISVEDKISALSKDNEIKLEAQIIARHEAKMLDACTDHIEDFDLNQSTGVNFGDLKQCVLNLKSITIENLAFRAENERLKNEVVQIRALFESSIGKNEEQNIENLHTIESLQTHLNDSIKENSILIHKQQLLEDRIASMIERNKNLFESVVRKVDTANQSVIEEIKANNHQLRSENLKLKSKLTSIDAEKSNNIDGQINEYFNPEVSFNEKLVGELTSSSGLLNEGLNEAFANTAKLLDSINLKPEIIEHNSKKRDIPHIVDVSALISKIKVPNFDSLIEKLSVDHTQNLTKAINLTQIVRKNPQSDDKSLQVDRLDDANRVERKNIETQTNLKEEIPQPAVVQPSDEKLVYEAKLSFKIPEAAETQVQSNVHETIIPQTQETIHAAEEIKTVITVNEEIPNDLLVVDELQSEPIENKKCDLKDIINYVEEKKIVSEGEALVIPHEEAESKDEVVPPPLAKKPKLPEIDIIENLPESNPKEENSNLSKLMAPPKNKLLLNKNKLPIKKTPNINTSPLIPPSLEVENNVAENPQATIRSPERKETEILTTPNALQEIETTNDAVNDPLEDNQIAQDPIQRDFNHKDTMDSTKTNPSTTPFSFNEVSAKKRNSAGHNQTENSINHPENETQSETNFKDNESLDDTASLKSLQMNDLHEYSGKASTNPFANKKENKVLNIFKKKTIISRNITQGLPDNLF